MNHIDSLLALEDERDRLDDALVDNRNKAYEEICRLAEAICDACRALLESDGELPSSSIEELHRDARKVLRVLDDADAFDSAAPAVRIGRLGDGYPCRTVISIFDGCDPVRLEVTDDDLEVLGLV